MIHELKTWPEHFQAIASRRKTVEIRKADRDFQVFDVVKLCEWSPETRDYTGEWALRTVTHILNGGQFGLEPGYVALSIA